MICTEGLCFWNVNISCYRTLLLHLAALGLGSKQLVAYMAFELN